MVAIALHQKDQGQHTRSQVLAGGQQAEPKGQLGGDRTGAGFYYSTALSSRLQGWWITTYRKHLFLMLTIIKHSQMDPDQEERQQLGQVPELSALALIPYPNNPFARSLILDINSFWAEER